MLDIILPRIIWVGSMQSKASLCVEAGGSGSGSEIRRYDDASRSLSGGGHEPRNVGHL